MFLNQSLSMACPEELYLVCPQIVLSLSLVCTQSVLSLYSNFPQNCLASLQTGSRIYSCGLNLHNCLNDFSYFELCSLSEVHLGDTGFSLILVYFQIQNVPGGILSILGCSISNFSLCRPRDILLNF